ncbi:hypothetical protein LSH36_356g06029 [Paralvinella palmiformis]|uniref:Protein DPCD n=1 Tax=Paralvinella palmiformis TaxID=53620 RepID=A0AAD9MZK4_9ANNE|nr:hypothetical protein LSH36_356g06029 [Paralvinella palmiformis]
MNRVLLLTFVYKMSTAWLENLKSAQKTCLVQDDRKKIHFTFQDGTEMAEEYDINTGDLLGELRKWHKKGTLGGATKWEYEVGEDLMLAKPLLTEGLMESSSNPIFVRKDTKQTFQWRIRNLPYPIETYQVTVDAENRTITIRTSNKKYYKRFSIPDMDRIQAALKQDDLSIAYANNTLIVTYKKPKEVLDLEKAVQEELKKTKAMKDGDVECNPS